MLADDIARALPQFRAEAERQMQDSCTITCEDPEATQGPIDPVTGQYPPIARITVYTGKCRVQIKSVIASSSDASAGERMATVQEFELQLPVVGTESVAINDVAEMLTCALDTSLEGRKFTVAARHEKSQATARRLRVIEVTG